MRIRPNTWDAKIITDVLIHNEYGLPDDMSGQVVLDIGAHIGAFAVSCQKRRAKRIICYEPDPENLALLAYNTDEDKESIAEILLVHAAVTAEDCSDIGLRRLSEHDGDLGQNTGHIDVFGSPDGTQGIGINNAIKAVGDPIDLLKIDCEGAEWGIFESGDFSKVKSVIAELHLVTAEGEHRILDTMKGKTLEELASVAVRKLRKSGFETSVTYQGPFLAHLTASKRVYAGGRMEVGERRQSRLLWIGDAQTTTGYARVTDTVCRHLVRKGWDVRVLGIGYNGDPHDCPYKIYPAVNPITGGHPTGLSRIKEIMQRTVPDAVVIQDDSWNVGIFIDNMAMLNCLVPTIGYIAVDSQNVKEETAVQLKNCRHVICHTSFGANQLAAAGYTGRISIAGHGVDTSLYTSYNKAEAREGLPIKGRKEDAFIWGVVAANQARKRLDLTIAYWAEWWKRAGKPANAYLYVHTNSGGAWDLQQLATYCGIRQTGRLLETEGGNQQLSDRQMPTLYNAFDVMISTSEGESFGLPLLEGLSCAIPQIAVRCGGAPDWAGDSIMWVEPSHYAFTELRINTKRWIASEQDFVTAMDRMYTDAALRADYAKRGMEKAKTLKWSDVGDHFDIELHKVLEVQMRAMGASANPLEEFV